MPDKRESILVRLAEIAATVDGFTTTGRNRADLEDEDLPALVVIDGDEDADEQDDTGRKAPGIRPRIMVMRPTISAVLLGLPEELGTKAAELRARLVNAIDSDTTLKGFCLNGRMSFEGTKTLPSSGGRGPLLGMSLLFTFTYIFRPQDLGPGSA